MKRLPLALTALCLLFGPGDAALAQPSSTVPTDCQQKYKELGDAVVNQLPYWEFDQSEAGWRQFGNCLAEQTQLLRRYLKRQEAEMRNVRWHLAQTLALEGKHAAASEQALLAVNPDESTQQPSFNWNSYVLATAAFLRGDRAEFDKHYEAHRLAAAAHRENETNFQVLTGLANCFGKPYREAYGRCPRAQ